MPGHSTAPGRSSIAARNLGLLTLLSASLLLAGCNTEELLLRQRLARLQAEEAALQRLHGELAAGAPALEAPGTLSVFLSKAVINDVLAAADQAVLPVPGLPGVAVTINSLRADFRMGFPSVNVEAVARKNGVDAALQLVGSARLEPVLEAGSPAHLNLHVHVDSLVPRASWGPFDFAVGGLVRDLAQVKLSEQARRIATIRVPMATELPLHLPAKQTPVGFTGVQAYVATPELSVQSKVEIIRVLPLQDGLHVYAKLSTGGPQ